MPQTLDEVNSLVNLHASQILADVGEMHESYNPTIGFQPIIDEVPPEVISRRQRMTDSLLEALRGEESDSFFEFEIPPQAISVSRDFNTTEVR